MRFIGIDPGKSGGIAVINEFSEIIETAKMPNGNAELLHLFARLEDDAVKQSVTPNDTVRAALEFVRSTPQMGVASSFTFGRGLGALEMTLLATNIPYYEVHPLRWQRMLDCLTGGDKNVSKARAAELWPGTKITHAIADALLIAEWCRRNTLGLKGNP